MENQYVLWTADFCYWLGKELFGVMDAVLCISAALNNMEWSMFNAVSLLELWFLDPWEDATFE